MRRRVARLGIRVRGRRRSSPASRPKASCSSVRSSTAMRALGDKIEAKRLAEASGVPARTVGRDRPRGRRVDVARGRRGRRLPADGEGIGRRRWPWHPQGRPIPSTCRPPFAPSSSRRGRRSVRAASSSSGASPARATSRSSSSSTPTASRRPSGCATARCSGGTRRCIEEAPSPVLSPVEESRLTGATARLARAAGYRGVGTAEFLYVADTRTASFCEVNARLQVEHTVTELVWGIDLVRAQIDDRGRACPTDHAAGPRGLGRRGPPRAPRTPSGASRPAPGKVLVHRPPVGPNIRVDAGVRAGIADPDRVRLARRQGRGLGTDPGAGHRHARVVGWPSTRS